MNQHLLFANEVGFEVGDGEVVGRVDAVRVLDPPDLGQPVMLGRDLLPGYERRRLDPARTVDPPRMIVRRLEDLDRAVGSDDLDLPDLPLMPANQRRDRLERSLGKLADAQRG